MLDCLSQWRRQLSTGRTGFCAEQGYYLRICYSANVVCWLSSVRRVQGPKQTAHWARCPQILQTCRSHFRSL